jgi:hypothetical protein
MQQNCHESTLPAFETPECPYDYQFRGEVNKAFHRPILLANADL